MINPPSVLWVAGNFIVRSLEFLSFTTNSSAKVSQYVKLQTIVSSSGFFQIFFNTWNSKKKKKKKNQRTKDS